MELMLERIEQRAGAQTDLHPLDLALVPDAIAAPAFATMGP
jgi:hypothetical protein